MHGRKQPISVPGKRVYKTLMILVELSHLQIICSITHLSRWLRRFGVAISWSRWNGVRIIGKRADHCRNLGSFVYLILFLWKFFGWKKKTISFVCVCGNVKFMLYRIEIQIGVDPRLSIIVSNKRLIIPRLVCK